MEFTSKALDDWAYRRGIKLDYTRPGKLMENGWVESFNRRLQPPPLTQLARQPDPERVRKKSVS